MDAHPFISIIVPVRNEARFIRQTLLGILRQDYPQFEVIVADGRSDDATRHIVSSLQHDWPNVLLVDNPRRLSSAGRNAAIRASRGDIILLIDGHCELKNRRYLADLAELFARSGTESVGRPQPLEVDGASPFQRAVAAARSSWLGHHPDSFIYADREQFVPPESVAIAYRRDVFARIGFFDESFDACEDVEFNHRLSRAEMRCYFSPRVRVPYHPRSTPWGLFKQMVRYGRGRMLLLRKHPDTFSFPCLVPSAFLAGNLMGPPLSLLFWPVALTHAFLLALYVAVVAVVSLGIAWHKRDLRQLPWLPLVFVTVHAGAGWGLLREAFAQLVNNFSPKRQYSPRSAAFDGRPEHGRQRPDHLRV
jgi:glycosyltransferase involved in cell wall biosynthesis